MSSICMEKSISAVIKCLKLGPVLYFYIIHAAYVWPWIWLKAVTSSHECMHHGAGVLIQTPPKNPVPWCGELLGLSQLLVTPSLSTHQWVRIRFSLSAGGKEMEIGKQGLQSMHLNNASMFKKWPHGWEVIGCSCAQRGAVFLVFIWSFCESLPQWMLWIFGYLIITRLIGSIASQRK